MKLKKWLLNLIEKMKTESERIKVALYVCLTIFASTWLFNNKLSEDTIIICQESCNSDKTYMESVTSQECICSSNKSKDIWITQ